MAREYNLETPVRKVPCPEACGPAGCGWAHREHIDVTILTLRGGWSDDETFNLMHEAGQRFLSADPGGGG